MKWGKECMSDYKIYELDKTSNTCIIFSTHYISPLKFKEDINNELKYNFNHELNIIFDFILSNGNNNKRFAKAYFNGDYLVNESIEYIHLDKDDEIRRISTQFYKENEKYVDFTFLNSVQRKLILRGIAI
jgi:hypothetical protein